MRETPFKETNLLISKKTVAISRLEAPFFTALFEHPDLCRAFLSYEEQALGQYRTDKITSRNMLKTLLG